MSCYACRGYKKKETSKSPEKLNSAFDNRRGTITLK